MTAPLKIDQTILHGDPARPGNCFAACVASALGLSLDDVPHFIEWGMKHYGDAEPHPDGGTGAHWHAMMLGFLAGRGLWPVPIGSLDDAEPGEVVFVAGPSPRGVPHQVLYRDGSLWHDPHPSHAGLLQIDEDDLFVIRPAGRHDHAPTQPGPQRRPKPTTLEHKPERLANGCHCGLQLGHLGDHLEGRP